MKKPRVLQEIRKMRFEEYYREIKREKSLTIEQVAKLLHVHERTVRRWCERYEEEGAMGLADKRLDRIAHNAAPTDEVSSMLSLFETRYPNFTVAHFYDKYRDCHGGERSYTWVKNQLQNAGYVKKAKHRGAHRRKRPREPIVGMMIHQDGSTHEWVPGKVWDLIVTLDDANSEIYSAFFVEEEGTWSSFQGVKEVITNHGLFCSLYTDRGSHYWTTKKVGEKVDKNNLTQFGSAMRKLGIQMIPAYSPEARGRSERLFRTLQSRLPKELTLAGVTDMQAANQFLKETFIRGFNKRFMVKPQESGSAFVPWLNTNLNIDDILCIQSERTVNKDNTVRYGGKILQIPKDTMRWSYQRANVTIHEYMDGTTGVFYGPRKLGRYDKEGQLIGQRSQDKLANIENVG